MTILRALICLNFKPTQIRICVVRSLGAFGAFLISVDKRIICVILN